MSDLRGKCNPLAGAWIAENVKFNFEISIPFKSACATMIGKKLVAQDNLTISGFQK